MKFCCRYDGWITELQQEGNQDVVGKPKGIDNLLYSKDAGGQIIHTIPSIMHYWFYMYGYTFYAYNPSRELFKSFSAKNVQKLLGKSLGLSSISCDVKNRSSALQEEKEYFTSLPLNETMPLSSTFHTSLTALSMNKWTSGLGFWNHRLYILLPLLSFFLLTLCISFSVLLE